ncbi:MAG TPA: RsmE family RNA methyltransferase [Actinomycetota bacterium]|nr:RsmE family RNA methyltransferase [Actinomycetota bacterium]
MSLPHFFAGAPAPGEPVVLSAEDARHAVRSLRMRVGDEFTTSDGEGALARARVTRAERLLVEAEVVDRTDEDRARPPVTVLLSPPKGDRLAWAVQKLTEVGVDEVVLLEAPRSVRRWTGDRAGRAAARLDGVAREAAKQARLRFLPRVSGPVPWVEAVAPDGGLMVIMWEEARRPLLDVLPDEPPSGVSLVIGPEGGIPEEDARAAERDGAALASLGTNILRTETAALAAASVVLSRYGRLG